MIARILMRLILGGLAFYSSPSLATFYGCTSTYYVLASFPSVYQNKVVKSVAIHAGVLEAKLDQQGHELPPYWENISIVDWQVMSPIAGDHFFTKYTTFGRRGGGDGGAPTVNLGPVIQYWIDFEDGSHLIEEPRSVKVRGEFGHGSPSELLKAVEKYDNETDSLETFAIETHQGAGCPH